MIGSLAIRELPLNGREHSSLALLTTGVRQSSLNKSTNGTPREGAFNVKGLRSVFNNFLIDGVDNNAHETSNQGFSNEVMQPAPDAVDEFRVVTNNQSAEYGRSLVPRSTSCFAAGPTRFMAAGGSSIGNDLRMNDRLTLNLGLRYEYATPMWESDNRLTNFDPSAVSMVPARSGGIADRALVNPDRNNFAPRVGLAYTLMQDTVMRGGWGIGYVHWNRIGSANLMAINGPQVIRAVVNQTDPKQLSSERHMRSVATSQSISQWFNPACVSIPTDPSQPFGNTARNSVRGPAYWTFDLAVTKQINAGAPAHLHLRLEAFNLFNRANFTAPNGNRSSDGFGTITSTCDSRQLEIGLVR